MSQLQKLANHLETARTEPQAKLILHTYLGEFGIVSYAFTYYSQHVKTGRKLRYHCVSEALRDWHLYYLDQAYADVDRTLEENATSSLPAFWDVHQQLRDAKNVREKRMREESIEFGIDQGLSIPIYGPQNDFAALTLHQRRGESCLSNYPDQQYEWQQAALIYYHYIKKLLQLDVKSVDSYHLTTREKQCLLLTAKSWRVEKIAKELNISSRSVNFHIQNANKKIGVNNKYQASYKWLEAKS